MDKIESVIRKRYGRDMKNVENLSEYELSSVDREAIQEQTEDNLANAEAAVLNNMDRISNYLNTMRAQYNSAVAQGLFDEALRIKKDLENTLDSFTTAIESIGTSFEAIRSDLQLVADTAIDSMDFEYQNERAESMLSRTWDSTF